MGKLYTIYPASEAEINEGWVWLKVPDLPSRTIVKIQNGGHSVFCEYRKIDSYFIENCKDDRHIELKDPNDALFIGAWYRDALGGFEPTSHSGNQISLDVTPGLIPVWSSLRAASHHPDFVARLGTRLGVVGTWLGIVALTPTVLEFTEWPKYSKLIVLIVFAVALAIVCVSACWGVTRPKDARAMNKKLLIVIAIVPVIAAAAVLVYWELLRPKLVFLDYSERSATTPDSSGYAVVKLDITREMAEDAFYDRTKNADRKSCMVLTTVEGKADYIVKLHATIGDRSNTVLFSILSRDGEMVSPPIFLLSNTGADDAPKPVGKLRPYSGPVWMRSPMAEQAADKTWNVICHR